jgi:nitrate reductase gamma subunit
MPASRPPLNAAPAGQIPPGDGARQLLQWGGSIFGTGILAAVLLETLLGGFSPTGASTNTGWFALIVALMCIPFGGLLGALGLAKWLRRRAGNRKSKG